MRVNVTLDTRDWQQGLDGLRRRFPAAIRRALLRAGNSGRTDMARRIAADTGLPVRRITSEISVNLVGGSAVQLEVRGNRIPLIDFRARGPEPSRGRGRGVSYRLPGGQGRAPNAFIATMRSGHRGVFQRTGRDRLPVYELKGPSLARVFARFLPEGAARAEEALRTNLRSEISFALRR